MSDDDGSDGEWVDIWRDDIYDDEYGGSDERDKELDDGEKGDRRESDTGSESEGR